MFIGIMRKTFSTNIIDSCGHAAVFYDDPVKLWRVLAEYFHTGFEQNELGVLVTQFSPKEVVESLRAAGLDTSKQIGKGDLRIFSMDSVYMPDGRFVADFMMGNVIDFADDARLQGYNGLRTAGEMNWLQNHPHYHDEAHLYEHSVNRIADENPDFTGLCFYAINNSTADSMPDMEKILQTHPTYYYQGALLKSPGYSTV